MALHISIAAEKITEIAGWPVTNSLLTTWLVMAVLVILALLGTKKLKKIPSTGQLIAELIVGGLYDFYTSILGSHTKKVFPLIATIFLFVLTANWFGLIPGVGTIGFWEPAEHAVKEEVVAPAIEAVTSESKTKVTNSHEEAEVEPITTVEVSHEEVAPEEEKLSFPLGDWQYWLTGKGAPENMKLLPLFRGPTADINTTLALSLITMVFVQIFGFMNVGISYLSKFINLKNPIFTFVGILEFVSEISRVISFTFRLFGNIFAGEVLLSVMAFLFAFGLPIPFLGLEIFVGVIQALVFSMLAAVFLNLAVQSHGDDHSKSH